MARIERLEGALVHITDLLVLQGERMDYGFTSLRDEMRAMRDNMQAMRDEMKAGRDEMKAGRDEARAMRESVSDRLDRLMAITTKERTSSIERLQSIEMRLARLEERIGI